MFARLFAVLGCLLFPSLVLADVGTSSSGTLPSIGNQTLPSLAWNGSQYLAVWHNRLSTTALSYGPPPALVAARISRDGTVLDRPGITLGRTIGVPSVPAAVAWCGGSFLVAFSQDQPRDSSITSTLVIARVSAEGTLLSAPMAVLPQRRAQEDPVLISSGSECLLAWRDFTLGVVASRVRSTTLVDNPPFVLSPANAQMARGVWTGTQYRVAWLEYTGEISSRTITDGVLSPATTLVPQLNGRRQIAMGVSSTEYMLAWEDGVSNSNHRYAQRYLLDGTQVDRVPIDLGVLDDSLRYALAVQPMATGFGVMARTVTTMGTVLRLQQIDASGVNSALTRTLPLSYDRANIGVFALAGPPDAMLAVFSEAPRPVDGSDIVAHRLDATGTAVNAVPSHVSYAAPLHMAPLVASIGSTALAVWTERRWVDRGPPYSYTYDAVGARFDAAGRVLDENGIELAAGPNNDSPTALSADRDGYLVAIEERPTNMLSLRRYGVDGRPFGAASVLTAATGFLGRARMVWNGRHHLVVWVRNNRLYAMRVDGNGTPVDSTPRELPGRGFTSLPTDFVLASNGDGWLLVGRLSPGIVLLPLDANGSTSLTAPVEFRVSMGMTVEETQPTVVWNGSAYQVSWLELSSDCRVISARFDQQAQLQGMPVASSGCAQVQTERSWPGSVFDGTRTLLVWRDDSQNDPTLVLRSFDTSGNALERAPMSLHSGREWRAFPAMAPLGDGRVLLAYLRNVEEAPFGTVRVRAEVYPAPAMVSPDVSAVDATTDAPVDVVVRDVMSATDVVDGSMVTDAASVLDVAMPMSDAMSVSDVTLEASVSSDVVSDGVGAELMVTMRPGCACTTNGMQTRGGRSGWCFLLGLLVLRRKKKTRAVP